MFKLSVISNAASFQLSSSVTAVDEGSVATITLTTTGVQNGFAVPYTISGTGITLDDFVGLASLSGTFVVMNNTASIMLTLSPDLLLEGLETLMLVTLNNGAAISVDVNDTSNTPPVEYWINLAGGTGSNIGKGVTADPAGNVIVVGIAGSQISLIKYGANGANIWQKLIGNAYTDSAAGVTTDSTGNIYIVGTLSSSASAYTGYVAKFNTDGNLLWNRTFGTTVSIGTGIALDGSFNVYVSGKVNNGHVVAKFDTSGTSIWSKIFSNVSIANGADAIAVTNSGVIYIAGSFFYGTVVTAAQNNGTLLKIDSSGTLVWLKMIGTEGYQSEQCVGLTLDSSENPYVLMSRVDGTSTLVKLTTEGAISWQRRVSGVTPGGLAYDGVDGMYLIGSTTTQSSGGTDMFIGKYNLSGAMQWQRLVGGTNNDQGYAISVDSSNLYITGSLNANSEVLTLRLPSSGALCSAGLGLTHKASTLSESAGIMGVGGGNWFYFGSSNNTPSSPSVGVTTGALTLTKATITPQ